MYSNYAQKMNIEERSFQKKKKKKHFPQEYSTETANRYRTFLNIIKLN